MHSFGLQIYIKRFVIRGYRYASGPSVAIGPPVDLQWLYPPVDLQWL